MTTTARRRRIQTSPVSRPMADCSQVWVPPPLDWPTPSAEQMADDARRRARFYSGSKFWREAMTAEPAELKQRELFA